MFAYTRRRPAIAASSPRQPLSPRLTRRLAHLAQRALTSSLLPVLGLAFFSAPAFADGARFDLTGPKIEVHVTRGSVTLPIASVPNLQPGDRIWLHPDLPQSQSVHYLLVLAFLRGTTNPPPDQWFTRIEAWDKKVRAEGVEVVVPKEAQQAVLFLAPVTGGDFSTLRSAVQGRPGVFVRASQDLALAGFQQERIEKYIAAMKQLPPAEIADAKQLQDHSNLIAATLALKPSSDCTKLPPDQQYTCLTQTGNQTLLDDGHGQTIADALSNGPGSDLINQASYTQFAGSGMYSAYVGTVVDVFRLMGSLHTAQYQYIPAIAFPQQEELNLRLNVAPSFHNPKSVIVIGLPAIQATTPPPLRPTDPNSVACLARPGVVLPVEGAPLVFSTAFAHDLTLHLNYPGGKSASGEPQDIPLTADAFKGGLVLAPIEKRRPLHVPSAQAPTSSSTTNPALSSQSTAPGELTGTIRGSWGFDTFTGPTMPLETVPGRDWRLTTSDQLIAGKDQHVQLASTGTACIDSITLSAGKSDSGHAEKESFKPVTDSNVHPNSAVDVELKLSALPTHNPQTLHLTIHQFGAPRPETVSLVSYSEPAHLTGLVYHAGDSEATLTGTSLDQVRQLKFSNATFVPGPSSASGLSLTLPAGSHPPAANPGQKLTAQVTLKDGRTLPLAVTIASARPALALLSKVSVASNDEAKQATGLPIKLGSPDDVPLRDALLFSLKSAQPFPRDAKIEVSTPDGSLHTILSIAAQTLILEDPHTLLAKLEPLKAFGPSTFGPIRLRAVLPDGSTGDWLPLATLVRLPSISAIACPPPPAPRRHHHAEPAPPPTVEPGPSTSPAAPQSSTPPAPTAAQPNNSSATGTPAQPSTTAAATPSSPATTASGPAESATSTTPPQVTQTSQTTPAAASPTTSTSQPTASAPASSESDQDKNSGEKNQDPQQATAAPAIQPAPAPTSSQPQTTPVPGPQPSAPQTQSEAQPEPPAAPATCTLTGSNLYLLDSAAPDVSFTNPTPVPPGFVSSELTVPAPSGPSYYLRLRDDPTAVATITLPAAK